MTLQEFRQLRSDTESFQSSQVPPRPGETRHCTGGEGLHCQSRVNQLAGCFQIVLYPGSWDSWASHTLWYGISQWQGPEDRSLLVRSELVKLERCSNSHGRRLAVRSFLSKSRPEALVNWRTSRQEPPGGYHLQHLLVHFSPSPTRLGELGNNHTNHKSIDEMHHLIWCTAFASLNILPVLSTMHSLKNSGWPTCETNPSNLTLLK